MDGGFAAGLNHAMCLAEQKNHVLRRIVQTDEVHDEMCQTVTH